jgi:DNA-binding transcriptional ArsR family regulator
MAGDADDPLTRLFRALADPTRRRLLDRLTLASARVTDLARPFRMSLPAVSKHLRVLERAGLVSCAVDGRVHRMTLRGAALRRVETWLDPYRAYWQSTFEELDAGHARRAGRRSDPSESRRTRAVKGRAAKRRPALRRP